MLDVRDGGDVHDCVWLKARHHREDLSSIGEVRLLVIPRVVGTWGVEHATGDVGGHHFPGLAGRVLVERLHHAHSHLAVRPCDKHTAELWVARPWVAVGGATRLRRHPLLSAAHGCRVNSLALFLQPRAAEDA